MAPKTKLSKAAKGKGIATSSSPPKKTKTRSQAPSPPPSSPPPSTPPMIEMMKGITEEEKHKFNTHFKFRDVSANTSLHGPTLANIGIEDEVHAYLNNLQWKNFCYPTEHGYDNLTKEFLNTLKLFKSRHELGFYAIEFRFFGKKFALSLNQFRQIFGFQEEGITHPSALHYSEDTFWREISIDSSFKNPSKASSLKTPTFFILHRIITFTMYAREEGNEKVTKKDLFFLFCLIHNHPVQSAKFFIDHLVHLSNAKQGTIKVSSYITMIAKALGVITSQTTPFLGEVHPYTFNKMIKDHYKSTKAFMEVDGKLIYIGGEEGFKKKDIEHAKKKARVVIQEGGPSTQTSKAIQTAPPPKTKSSFSIEKMLKKIYNKLKVCQAQHEHLHGDIIQLQRHTGTHECVEENWVREAPPSEEEEEEEEDDDHDA